MAIAVNVDNFVRAETERMFAAVLADTGAVNVWSHNRVPTPLDHQLVIRMNRDTLYSTAIIDISNGASISVPDGGDRYVSVMVVNQDHYINRIIHEPGEHELTVDEFDTPYVLVAARVLVDAGRPGDIEVVNELQDQFRLRAASANPPRRCSSTRRPWPPPGGPLLELARGVSGFAGAFGTKADVDPVRHLIGTAAGWGGLPESEAYYLNVDPGLPVGHYRLTVGDVPVDAFWSISLYNAAGYFEPNDRNANSVNSVTAASNGTARSPSTSAARPEWPNSLPIMDGWNYPVRLYRPRPEILDGAGRSRASSPRSSLLLLPLGGPDRSGRDRLRHEERDDRQHGEDRERGAKSVETRVRVRASAASVDVDDAPPPRAPPRDRRRRRTRCRPRARPGRPPSPRRNRRALRDVHQERPRQRGDHQEPASAVPSDDPRFVSVF